MKSILIGAIAAVSSFVLVIGCGDSQSPSAPATVSNTDAAPVLKSVPDATRIPGSYIVVFKKEQEAPAAVASQLSATLGFRIDHTYDIALAGFAASIPDDKLQQLLQDRRIDYIEPDQIVHTCTQTLPWGIDFIGGDSSSTVSGNGSGSVSGVRIYIIDTGIQTNHPDLNVVGGYNYSGGSTSNYADGNGHGTHVAGIAAARDNSSYVVGVAPGAPLYAVRVLGSDGSGSTSNVIAGVNYVAQQKRGNSSVPMVANLSLGGSHSSSLDQAVASCVSAGVVVCVAAGNSGADASTSSPADVSSAITVGAFDANERITSWSNYGSYVDILAPGNNILSTYMGTTTATLSGTSMATPHVTGAAALYLSKSGNGSKTPAQVDAALKSAAGPWINVSVNGTPRANTTNKALRVRSF